MKSKFEDFYLRFENQFRGTREDIKSRQSVYLKLLNLLHRSESGDEILDIGCGRGEWLELLKEHGWRAYGLDLNDVMVERCRQIGLNVQYGDALLHMRELKENSLICISGFHIVEHLPFDVLLEVFLEALRILKPGGLLILETPNPENLQVGAHTFYFDPTHKRPLPPGLLGFMASDSGFGLFEIVRLHPYPELAFAYLKNSAELERNFSFSLYSSQDYSLIAVKTDFVTEDVILKIKDEIMEINRQAISIPISLAEMINNKESIMLEMEARLSEMESLLIKKQREMDSCLKSYSWRITFPLRFGLKIFKKVINLKK